MTKKTPARLSDEDVSDRTARRFYEPGRPYLWVLTHGWVCVGYYVTHPDPLTIRVAHGNYYRSAGGQTHARLARHGGNAQTTWEYTGDELLTVPHVIRVTPYDGVVPHGRVAHR